MDAGRFAHWIVAVQQGMRSGDGNDVPCGGCVACCTSGQLVPVDDDERGGLPPHAVVDTAEGAVLARTDEGACLSLADGRCTVYETRPRACRIYDCRIFAATGLEPEEDKPAIREQAKRWRFRVATDEDRRRSEAVRATVVMLRMQQVGGRPTSTTQLAARAVLHHDELLQG